MANPSMRQVVKFITEQGAGNIQRHNWDDTCCTFTTPNNLEGQVIILDSGQISEVIDGNHETHADLEAFKAAWLKGTDPEPVVHAGTGKTSISTVLEPFDASDWELFPGCESKTPMSAFIGESWIVVLDDERVSVFNEDTDGPTEERGEFTSPMEAEQVARELLKVYDVLGEDAFRILWVGMLSCNKATKVVTRHK